MRQAAHITRIFGTNKDGDVLPDMWVDVERIHAISYNIVTPETTHQKANVFITWGDDPDYPDYGPEDGAKVVRKICRPDEADFENPEEWVPVRVFSQVRFSDADKTQRHTFRVAEPSCPDTRRIVHYDTNIDDRAQIAVENGYKAYVIAAADYEADRETKDEDQYIEQQIINNFKTDMNHYTRSGGQEVSVYLEKRHPLIDDETDPAPDARNEELGPDNLNPPYLLDPYQVIINVQLGVPLYMMGGTVATSPMSKDDTSWTLQALPSGGRGIAYGSGTWIAAGTAMATSPDGEKWTERSSGVTFGTCASFGKVKLGLETRSVFVAGDLEGNIHYSEDKGVTWAIVVSFAGLGTGSGGAASVTALAFLNGRFYAGIQLQDSHSSGGIVQYEAYVAAVSSSSDGRSWSNPVRVFKEFNVTDAIGNVQNVGSIITGLAYGNDGYVAVGHMLGRMTDPAYRNRKLAVSATSGNGTTWSGSQLLDGTSAGPSLFYGGSSSFLTLNLEGNARIAFGNGVFVTGSSAYRLGGSSATVGAVYQSTNGASWQRVYSKDSPAVVIEIVSVIFDSGKFRATQISSGDPPISILTYTTETAIEPAGWVETPASGGAYTIASGKQ